MKLFAAALALTLGFVGCGPVDGDPIRSGASAPDSVPRQDPQYPHQTGRELYCKQDGQPILLLCNGTPDTPDITAVVYCTTGRTLDWSPQFSAGTGSPEPVEGVDVFSNHPASGAAP